MLSEHKHIEECNVFSRCIRRKIKRTIETVHLVYPPNRCDMFIILLQSLQISERGSV